MADMKADMITTHVLDLAQGVPAAGVAVTLEFRQTPAEWRPVGGGVTDGKGRLTALAGEGPLVPGTYRLSFDIDAYYRLRGLGAAFFPVAEIAFRVSDGAVHYHIPLLISPFGYSTYRGA